MHITDTQDTQLTSPDTLRFITAALDSQKPDLVVFTGDTVKGYGLSIKFGDSAKNCEKTILHTLEPLIQRGVPFTFTFGNHDRTEKSTGEMQTAVYENCAPCVNGEMLSRLNGTDCMCLPIYTKDGKIAFALYLIDNCGRIEGKYNGVTDEQKQWMVDTSDLLKEKNGGKEVPVTVFQHIPVYEMYDVLDEVEKDTPGALEGNRTHRGKYYALTAGMRVKGEMMGENVASTSQNGEFEIWRDKTSVKAAFFGHDHINSFTGFKDGIMLGYTPGAGFNVYGPGTKRAVRIFDYDETGDFETHLVTYEDLLGKKVLNPIKMFLYNYAPTSVDDAKIKGKKAAPYLAGAAVLTVFGIARAKRRK